VAKTEKKKRKRLTSQAKYMITIEAVWSKQARKELLIFRFEAYIISQNSFLVVMKVKGEFIGMRSSKKKKNKSGLTLHSGCETRKKTA
jgi:hypothetical protein